MGSLRVASLFSGAGGLDLGLEKAGHDVILMADSDPGCRQVLRHAFPGVRVHDDVTTLDALPEETELLAAGFPCIDVSRAGLRQGLDGQSTGLVRHVFRLLRKAIDDRRPIPWVLMENVEALLDRHGTEPPVMQYVLHQLRQLGYQSVAWRVVNSATFGLPNRRRRIFIVASMYGDARDMLLTQGVQRCSGGCTELFDGRRCYACHMDALRERRHHANVSYALDMGNAQSPAGEDAVPTLTTSNNRMLLLLAGRGAGMLRVEDAERLQGLPEGHTMPCWPIQQPGVAAHRRKGVQDADGEASASKRMDLIGNAVSVPVGQWLGERLKHPYQYKYHGVSVGDRRMDHLADEGIDREGRERLRQGQQGQHVWSYLAADSLTEGYIYPYLPDAKKRRAKGGVDSEEGKGKEEEEPEGGEGKGEQGEEEEEPLEPEAAAAAAEAAEVAEAAAALHAAAAEAARDEVASWENGAGEEGGAHGGATAPAPAAAPATPGEASMDGGAGQAPAVATAPAADEGEQAAVEAVVKAVTARHHKLMSQAELVRKKQRGLLQQHGKQQETWSKDAWPRAGWYMRGIGCFACAEISDAPVPAPFVPLADFIDQLGRDATQEELHTYLHRLRSKGWDTTNTIQKLVEHRTLISSEAHEIVRLDGLLTDAAMIGDIVWAHDAVANCWWPGEVLDPLDPPAGRALPEGAEAHLEATQKLASLPRYRNLALSRLTDAQRAEHNRVLVCFLPVGNASWRWYSRNELDSFEYNAAREQQVNKLLKQRSFKHLEQLAMAIKDAKASLHIKNSRSCLEAERMRSTRAATAAAAVDLKQRCGSCRACMNSMGGQRRYDCLTQRMRAAALSGHAGAQVAVNLEGAVGASLEVWWAGDQLFYSGTVAHFDAVSTEHTVCYDDGEVGMHKLWQHDERIRIVTPPSQWGRDAAIARHSLLQAQERLSKQKKTRREAVPLPAQLPPTPLTELQKRNKVVFNLMLGNASLSLQRTGALPEQTEEDEAVLAEAIRNARQAAAHPGEASPSAPAARTTGKGGRGGGGKGRKRQRPVGDDDEAGPSTHPAEEKRCGSCTHCIAGQPGLKCMRLLVP